MTWLPWKRERRTRETHPVTRPRTGGDVGFGRLFDDWFSFPLSRRMGLVWGDLGRAPALDVRETDDEIVVEIEAPGIEPGELDISVTGDTLTVKGERKSERDEEKGDYHVTERSHGSFVRTVKLSSLVDREKATAEHRNGVVTISLPKTEESKPKKIEVK